MLFSGVWCVVECIAYCRLQQAQHACLSTWNRYFVKTKVDWTDIILFSNRVENISLEKSTYICVLKAYIDTLLKKVKEIQNVLFCYLGKKNHAKLLLVSSRSLKLFFQNKTNEKQFNVKQNSKLGAWTLPIIIVGFFFFFFHRTQYYTF